jgi:Na+/melibiose symporter-like transporter
LLTLTNETGYALSVGITQPLLDLIGLSGRAGATNTSQALIGILVVFVVLPATLLTLRAAMLWHFPLGENERLRLSTRLAEGAVGGRPRLIRLAKQWVPASPQPLQLPSPEFPNRALR